MELVNLNGLLQLHTNTICLITPFPSTLQMRDDLTSESLDNNNNKLASTVLWRGVDRSSGWVRFGAL